MSWISSIFKDKAPSQQVNMYTDPAKTAVANPLSAYLASEVGKGLPQYSGTPVPKVDDALSSRYSEFLGLNANDLFDKYIAEPSTKSFREDFLPVIQEGYAGNLRGSGRYFSEEGAINKFSQDLSGLRYKANTEIPLRQMEAATSFYNIKNKEYEMNYKQWADSLPGNNPAIRQALDFLNKGTESGLYASPQNIPGQAGGSVDILGSLLGFASSPAGAATGAAIAGAGSSIMGALTSALAFI